MNSNETICSRCGTRSNLNMLVGWQMDPEGRWYTCPQCVQSIHIGNQNRNLVTPRARRSNSRQTQPPPLQRRGNMNFSQGAVGPRRSISHHSAFNTLSNVAQPGYLDSPSSSSSSSSSSSGMNMPPSIVLQETQPMDISDDEDDYMSSDVDNSDPQMVSSTTTTSSSSASGHKVVRRTKTEAIKELELQIETAHNYNINPTNVNRSASSYDVCLLYTSPSPRD